MAITVRVCNKDGSTQAYQRLKYLESEEGWIWTLNCSSFRVMFAEFLCIHTPTHTHTRTHPGVIMAWRMIDQPAWPGMSHPVLVHSQSQCVVSLLASCPRLTNKKDWLAALYHLLVLKVFITRPWQMTRKTHTRHQPGYVSKISMPLCANNRNWTFFSRYPKQF